MAPADGASISTASGGWFYFDRPNPKVEDIAHGLSHVCRFSGQCSSFYSVAQHSVLMCREYLRRWEGCMPGGVTERAAERVALAILFHDSAEAYLADLPGPLKKKYGFGVFDALEKRILEAVANLIGIDAWLFSAPIVKELDRGIVLDELRELFPHGSAAEGHPYHEGDTALGLTINPWSPELAREEFMTEWRWLG